MVSCWRSATLPGRWRILSFCVILPLGCRPLLLPSASRSPPTRTHSIHSEEYSTRRYTFSTETTDPLHFLGNSAASVLRSECRAPPFVHFSCRFWAPLM